MLRENLVGGGRMTSSTCIHPRSPAKRHWSCSSPGGTEELLLHKYCTAEAGWDSRKYVWPRAEYKASGWQQVYTRRQAGIPSSSFRTGAPGIASAVQAGYHTGTGQPCYTFLVCWEASIHPQRDVLLHLPTPPGKKWECVRNFMHIFCVELNKEEHLSLLWKYHLQQMPPLKIL